MINSHLSENQSEGLLGKPYCLLRTVYYLLRKVPAFTAGDGIRAVNVDANVTPRSVAHFVGRTIRQSVKRAKICHHSFVSAGKVCEFLAFIKRAATGVSQLLQLVMS